MMIFPQSSGMQTIYITAKTKPHTMQMLIEEKWITPDDPLRPLIEAFINQPNVGEVRIRNRIRLVFR